MSLCAGYPAENAKTNTKLVAESPQVIPLAPNTAPVSESMMRSNIKSLKLQGISMGRLDWAPVRYANRAFSPNLLAAIYLSVVE